MTGPLAQRLLPHTGHSPAETHRVMLAHTLMQPHRHRVAQTRTHAASKTHRLMHTPAHT